MRKVFILFQLMLTSLIAQSVANPAWKTVIASQIPGVNGGDGCNWRTGLNTVGTACTDYGAVVNAQLTRGNITLLLDIAIGTSVGIAGPQGGNWAIIGSVGDYSGFFALPNCNCSVVSNGYILPLSGAAPTQVGQVIVRDLGINGNYLNQNMSIVQGCYPQQGTHPGEGIFLANLKTISVSGVQVIQYPAYAMYALNFDHADIVGNHIVGNVTTCDDAFHFSGPWGSVTASRNKIESLEDDAFSFASCEYYGGNGGPFTVSDTVIHNTYDLMRVYNVCGNGIVYPISTGVVDGVVGDVYSGPTALFYLISTGNNDGATYDAAGIKVSHINVTAGGNPLMLLTGNWSEVTCEDATMNGNGTTAQPLITVNASDVISRMSITGCGWYQSATKHASGTILNNYGTIHKLHVDAFCDEYSQASGYPQCPYVLAGNSGSSIGTLEMATPNGNAKFAALWASGTQSYVTTVCGDLSGFPMTIANLPTGACQGEKAVVTNAQAVPVYLGTVSTTGSVVAPVMYNGTNWVYE